MHAGLGPHHPPVEQRDRRGTRTSAIHSARVDVLGARRGRCRSARAADRRACSTASSATRNRPTTSQPRYGRRKRRKREVGVGPRLGADVDLRVVVGRRQRVDLGEQLGRRRERAAPAPPPPAATAAAAAARPPTAHARPGCAVRVRSAIGARRGARRRRAPRHAAGVMPSTAVSSTPASSIASMPSASSPGPDSSSAVELAARRAAPRACPRRRPGRGRRTTMRSASHSVERRWAMRIVVRPLHDPAQRGVDLLLDPRVDRRGGVVEQRGSRDR